MDQDKKERKHIYILIQNNGNNLKHIVDFFLNLRVIRSEDCTVADVSSHQRSRLSGDLSCYSQGGPV